MRTSGGPTPTGRADGVKSDPLQASSPCAEDMVQIRLLCPTLATKGGMHSEGYGLHVDPHASVGGIMLGGPGAISICSSSSL